ncbi:hypothetical protein PIECOFPK_02554 [Mycovorax composti]|jgi:Lysophospholipase L1 and related esterases
MLRLCVSIFLLVLSSSFSALSQADSKVYLKDIKEEFQKQWPKNRTINLVFHGHSVPTGYFRTPHVHTLSAYPFLTLQKLKERYPYAVINCITTSIGGENSVQGAKRFKKEVLSHRPDVLFIDYALNDRAIGLAASRKAMEQMIATALKHNIKVILLTPSPDLTEDIRSPNAVLQQFTKQLIELAEKYKIGLVDSYAAFRELALSGKNINEYMAQSNHPNQKGHEIIAEQIISFF